MNLTAQILVCHNPKIGREGVYHGISLIYKSLTQNDKKERKWKKHKPRQNFSNEIKPIQNIINIEVLNKSHKFPKSSVKV